MKSIYLTILLSLLLTIPFKVAAQKLNFPSVTAEPQLGIMSVICDNTVRMTTMIKDQFQETTALSGILNANQSQIFQVLLNPKTQTWTLILTDAKGVSCLVAAGKPLIIYDYFKMREKENYLENK